MFSVVSSSFFLPEYFVIDEVKRRGNDTPLLIIDAHGVVPLHVYLRFHLWGDMAVMGKTLFGLSPQFKFMLLSISLVVLVDNKEQLRFHLGKLLSQSHQEDDEGDCGVDRGRLILERAHHIV